MPCIQPGTATCPHSSPSAIGTVCQVTQDALLSPEGCPVLTAPRSPRPRRWPVMGGRACSSATFPLPERVASTHMDSLVSSTCQERDLGCF